MSIDSFTGIIFGNRQKDRKADVSPYSQPDTQAQLIPKVYPLTHSPDAERTNRNKFAVKAKEIKKAA